MDPRAAARMLFDLFLINEFEHALLELKNDDCVWGPVHTSVGQEAIAAGGIAALRDTDKVMSTHRAHHHFLSKVLYHVLPGSWDPAAGDIPAEGLEAVYRTMSEIMGLADGYCGGRGGSMHLRCSEAGFLGSNAIVGGGIPIATGAAFAEKFNNTENVVVCFFGDGATNQGAFHEACNLAGLWKLPVIFFLENNGYGVGTSTAKSCSVKDLSVRAGSYGMDGHIVDGNDPVAVYSVVKEAADKARTGGGPCLIEAKCYRRYHHAGDRPGSVYKYRTEEEEKEWLDKEAVTRFPEILLEAGMLTEEGIARIRERASACVSAAVDRCTAPGTPWTCRSCSEPALQPDWATAVSTLWIRSDSTLSSPAGGLRLHPTRSTTSDSSTPPCIRWIPC